MIQRAWKTVPKSAPQADHVQSPRATNRAFRLLAPGNGTPIAASEQLIEPMTWSFDLLSEPRLLNILAVRTQEASFACGLWSMEACCLKDGGMEARCIHEAVSVSLAVPYTLMLYRFWLLGLSIWPLCAMINRPCGVSSPGHGSTITMASKCRRSEERVINIFGIARARVEDVRC